MAWASDYATASQLAAFMRIGDTDDDFELTRAIAASSRAIDLACNRQFGLVAAPEARYYPARWDRRTRRYVVAIDDLMTDTDLEVEQDGAAAPGYELWPRNAAAEGRPWTELRLPSAEHDVEFEVTARWGWSAVPAAVEQACLLQASRLVQRRDSPYGIAGSPQTGSELRLLARVDPDVEVSLRAYVRWWAAA